jgi:pantothenate kinase
LEDAIEIGRETGIVILDGNYVNLDREPWRAAARLFDVTSLDAQVCAFRAFFG